MRCNGFVYANKDTSIWYNDEVDTMRLSNNRVYKTREGVVQVIEAITGKQYEDR